MRYICFALIFTVAVSLSAELNQMRIVGKAEKTSDIVPARYRTVNNETAACIIFITDLTVDLDFRPRVELVALVNPAPGQFHVYVAPNERAITVHASGYIPMTLVLRDYGISVLGSGEVYRLQLTGDKTDHIADRDLYSVQFDINQTGVYISHNNGVPIPVRGNTALFRVSGGSNSFRFIKQGFEEKNAVLEVHENISQSISLTAGTAATALKLPGFISIDSEPANAEIYLNDQLIASTPYTGEFIAGNYKYALRMPLYHTAIGDFTLNEGEVVRLPLIKLAPNHGTLLVNSTPLGATVIINEQNRGQTPLAPIRLASGNYDIEIRLDLHHPYQERITINDEENKRLDINLKPAFGELRISSSPESGAKVFIDDNEIGTTPYVNNRQPSRRYLVRVEKELWSATTRYIEVKDGERTIENFNLTPNHTELVLISEGSDIYLNDRYVGKNRYADKLSPGRYEIIAKKDRHKDAAASVFLQTGQREELMLEPEPIMGVLSVTSQPFASQGAQILLDGKRTEQTTPAVMPLLIGEYQVTLKHRDFIDATRRAAIKDGETHRLEFLMQTYQGSMQQKANFWKTNKWAALTGTAIAIGGAVFFDTQVSKYEDEYKNPQHPHGELQAYKNYEKAYDNRELCLYISIAPAAYTLFSWIRQASYNRRIR